MKLPSFITAGRTGKLVRGKHWWVTEVRCCGLNVLSSCTDGKKRFIRFFGIPCGRFKVGREEVNPPKLGKLVKATVRAEEMPQASGVLRIVQQAMTCFLNEVAEILRRAVISTGWISGRCWARCGTGALSPGMTTWIFPCCVKIMKG